MTGNLFQLLVARWNGFRLAHSTNRMDGLRSTGTRSGLPGRESSPTNGVFGPKERSDLSQY